MCEQVEQFHTVIKGLARGLRNTMASIRNNYLLLVSSNFTRLTCPLPIDWVVQAKGSTAAGFLARDRSADKKDLFVAPRGKGKAATLTAEDLLQLQEVWGRTVPDYGLFRARFDASNKRLPRHLRLSAISEWTGSRDPLTLEERTWQLMDGNIRVPCASFCTVPCVYAHVHACTHIHTHTHTHCTTYVRTARRAM